MYWHRHFIWVSNYNIKRIRYSFHYYLDAIYISKKEFYELLILIHFDINSKKKIPGAYILLNSKFENSYIIVLKALKKIITCENSIKLNVYSITLDFEEASMNAVNKVFHKIHIVGCLFHFVKKIILKLGKYRLLKEEYLEDSNILLKELSKAPFTIYKNNNFITEILDNSIRERKDRIYIE